MQGQDKTIFRVLGSFFAGKLEKVPFLAPKCVNFVFLMRKPKGRKRFSKKLPTSLYMGLRFLA